MSRHYFITYINCFITMGTSENQDKQKKKTIKPGHDSFLF